MSEERNELFEQVYKQIERDVYVEDYSAIYELIQNCSDEQLINYLPEDEYEEI